MKKLYIFPIISLMLLGPILGVSLVHGATGTVCIQDPASTPDCTTPGSFQSASFAPGKTLTVAVNIAGSDALNGFAIQVLTDGSALRGASVSLANSILPTFSTSIVNECLDGVLKVGTVCSPTDGVGVVFLAAAASGFLSTAPTTGNLFTITYNIVGRVGPTSIGFQTGCSGTSTSNTCVTISNGFGTPNSESTQAATFANLNDFTIVASPSATSIQPNTMGSSALTVTALGLFADTVSLTVSSSPGISAALSTPTSFALNAQTGPRSGSTTVSYSSPTVAVSTPYKINVTGTSSTAGSHSVIITVIVSPPDFLLTVDNPSLTVPAGSSGTAIVGVSSLTGFSGSVTISTSVSPVVTGGPTAGLSTTLFTTVPAYPSTATSTLTVSTISSTPVGSYTVTVSGNNGAHSVSVAVTVPPPDFSLIASPNSLVGLEGSPQATSAVVTSLNNFAGTVSLTVTVGTAGLTSPLVPGTVTATLATSSVTLSPGQQLVDGIAIGVLPNAALGNYTFTIVGTATIRGATVIHQDQALTVVEDFGLFLINGCPTVSPSDVPQGCDVVPTGTARGRGAVIAFLKGTSKGGLTGFGTFGEDIGPNCLRFIVPRIALTLQCFLVNIYFENGTLVPRAQIRAHGPYVILPRFLFPVPDNSTFVNVLAGTSGCGPPVPCDGSDTGFVRARVFADTLPGNYTLRISGAFGPLFHAVPDYILRVPVPPMINQMHFTHKLSLAKTGGVQTFFVGIVNTNNPTTLDVQIVVSGLANDGHSTFTVSSDVFTLAPQQVRNNNPLSVTFTSAQLGLTYTFSVTLVYGLSPTSLTAKSTTGIDTDTPTGGSFTIVA